MSEVPQRWTVGEAILTRVVESQIGGIPPELFFPEATGDDIRSCEWLGDGYAASDGTVALAVQAFVLQWPDLTAVVDPCVGNSKARALPFWNDQQLPWLERLTAIGVTPESVDVVVHTHLHADHVGWGTRFVDGEWQPTFARARYVYVGDELDYWRAVENRTTEDVYGDSVGPVVEAGLADVVDADAEIYPGLQLVPTPGHTPGHVSLEITSAGETLVVTGDVVHHPVQLAYAEWREIGDWDPALARVTRREFLDRHATAGTVLAGTHFPTAPVGRVRAERSRWQFEPEHGR